MAQLTLDQINQVAGAPPPDQPTAVSLNDVNRVLQNAQTKT